MLACAAWIDDAVAPPLTLLLATALSLLAADIMFKPVERPSILLSRAAGSRQQARTLHSIADGAPVLAIAGGIPPDLHDHAATPAGPDGTDAAPRSAQA